MRSDERREAIVRAVVPVFAKRGFHGSTTKELARAAEVSEALLYRHFPSKKSLYAAIGSQHLEDPQAHPGLAQLLAMKPSTKRLVHAVYYLVAHIARPQATAFPRLMTHSLLGDGVFAETILNQFMTEFQPFLAASIEAAKESRDLAPQALPPELAGWFVHHLAFTLKLLVLPGRPVADYGRSREDTILEAVRFSLRGMGLEEPAIRKFVNTRAFAVFHL
jgi:AcrR family transcriptional regulator